MAAIVSPVIETANSFKLSWVLPAQPAGVTVAGFEISYGQSMVLGSYQQIKDPTARSAIFNNLAVGSWYFQIRAYTAAGKSSSGSALYRVVI